MSLVLWILVSALVLGLLLAFRPTRILIGAVLTICVSAILFAVGIIVYLWWLWLIILIIYVGHHFAVKYW